MSIIFLKYFAYLLLVLVELLKIVCAHAGDALRLSLVTMLLITEHANLELGAGDVLQPNLKSQNLRLPNKWQYMCIFH